MRELKEILRQIANSKHIVDSINRAYYGKTVEEMFCCRGKECHAEDKVGCAPLQQGGDGQESD